MNNHIIEDYSSYEVSKLLEEKGCKIDSFFAYSKKGLYYKYYGEDQRELVSTPVDRLHSCDRIPYNMQLAAIPHHLAIKWIRENFGISISANREAYYQEVYDKYIYNITWPINGERKAIASPYFEKFEEAIEAALLYTLKNLIP